MAPKIDRNEMLQSVQDRVLGDIGEMISNDNLLLEYMYQELVERFGTERTKDYWEGSLDEPKVDEAYGELELQLIDALLVHAAGNTSDLVRATAKNFSKMVSSLIHIWCVPPETVRLFAAVAQAFFRTAQADGEFTDGTGDAFLDSALGAGKEPHHDD
jgi:hypothetical protein